MCLDDLLMLLERAVHRRLFFQLVHVVTVPLGEADAMRDGRGVVG